MLTHATHFITDCVSCEKCLNIYSNDLIDWEYACKYVNNKLATWNYTFSPKRQGTRIKRQWMRMCHSFFATSRTEASEKYMIKGIETCQFICNTLAL